MNNVANEHHETTLPLNAFLFVDKLPETQSLEIQNTNKDSPIQLKVDSSTDYWAVGATVFLSVFASIVAAWITVKLVSNSNKALIDSQNTHQNNLLAQQNDQHQGSINAQKEHQQREVLAKNRQEWINDVRKIIAQIISDSQNAVLNMHKENEIRKITHSKILNEQTEDKIAPAPFPDTVQVLHKIDFQITYLDLLLSKDNTLDRAIYDDLKDLNTTLNSIYQLYCIHGVKVSTSGMNDYIKPKLHDYHNTTSQLISKTKDLLKAEWIKVKELQ